MSGRSTHCHLKRSACCTLWFRWTFGFCCFSSWRCAVFYSNFASHQGGSSAMERNPARTWARWRSIHQRRSNFLDGVFVGVFHFSQLTPLEFLVYDIRHLALKRYDLVSWSPGQKFFKEKSGARRFRYMCQAADGILKTFLMVTVDAWKLTGTMLKMISWNCSWEHGSSHHVVMNIDLVFHWLGFYFANLIRKPRLFF